MIYTITEEQLKRLERVHLLLAREIRQTPLVNKKKIEEQFQEKYHTESQPQKITCCCEDDRFSYGRKWKKEHFEHHMFHCHKCDPALPKKEGLLG